MSGHPSESDAALASLTRTLAELETASMRCLARLRRTRFGRGHAEGLLPDEPGTSPPKTSAGTSQRGRLIPHRILLYLRSWLSW
jgi:hypothetical protein